MMVPVWLVALELLHHSVWYRFHGKSRFACCPFCQTSPYKNPATSYARDRAHAVRQDANERSDEGIRVISPEVGVAVVCCTSAVSVPLVSRVQQKRH